MKLLSYEEIDSKLDGLYNHPVKKDDLFVREYEAAVDQLALDIKVIGSVRVDDDEFGVDVDFSMSKHSRISSVPVVQRRNSSRSSQINLLQKRWI